MGCSSVWPCWNWPGPRAWAGARPGPNRWAFDGGRVELLVAIDDVQAALAGWPAAQVDAWFLDGFAPARNPRMWSATKQVMKQFEELTARHGGINCCQIAGVDWMDRDQVKDFYANPESRRKHCIEVVGETAKALGELLEQEAERAAAKAAEGK